MQLEKDGDSLLIKPNIIQLNSNGQTKQVKLINGILEISGGIIDISYNNDPDSHFTVLNTGQVGVGVDNIGDDKLKINGNVMINTPDEFTRYPLTVNGYRNVDSLEARILRTSGRNDDETYSNTKISMRIEKSLWIQDGGVLVSSDSRIKTNIVPIDDESALTIVNNIETYKYNYMTDASGVTPVYGYIAQQVKEQLPYAVTLVENYIPSVLKICNINTQMPDNKVEILLNNIPNDDNMTGKYLFYCYKDNESYERREETTGERIQENTIRCLLPNDYTSYFCYGWQINDFNILNKERINALHHSAIQHLSKTTKQLQETNDSIKQDITLIKQKLGLE